MLYAIVAVLIIILDQASKLWISSNIAFGEGIKELIPGVISLVNVHNTGAAFGFLSGSNAKVLLIGICVVLVVAVVAALATNFISGSLGRWSAVCIMAGGVGNCIDRIINGYVQDMIKTEFIDFYVFNVADIFIVVFGVLFIIYVLFGGKGKTADEYDDEDEDELEDEADDLPPVRRRGARFEEADEDAPVVSRNRLSRRTNIEEDEVEEKPLKRRSSEFDGTRKWSSESMARSAQPEKVESKPMPDTLEPVVRKHSQKPLTGSAKYEAEYDRFVANRAARQRSEADTTQPVKRPVAKVDPSDPFAEWERANREAQAERKVAVAERTAVKAPVAKPVEQKPVVSPVIEKPTEPAPAPVQPAAPTKKDNEYDFSLDDILNEFK